MDHGGNGKQDGPLQIQDPGILRLVILMDPKTRNVELEGNIVVDRPTCMMMLEEAKLGIIDYHREQDTRPMKISTSSLVFPGS